MLQAMYLQRVLRVSMRNRNFLLTNQITVFVDYDLKALDTAEYVTTICFVSVVCIYIQSQQ